MNPQQRYAAGVFLMALGGFGFLYFAAILLTILGGGR